MDARILISCFIILAGWLNVTYACSCMISHPQTYACSADFVIVAKVKREILKDEQKFYKIKIKRELKMSNKSTFALKSGRLVTADDEAKCGVHLDVNKVYLITGKIINLQARINLCNYIELFSEVTARQRKGFKKLYYQGCNCKIDKCFFGGCQSAYDACTLNIRHPISSNCEMKHGICLRNSQGECHWMRNMAQKNCMKKINSSRQSKLDLEP